MAERSAKDALLARRTAGGKGLIPYLTAGYPDWDRFDAAAIAAAESGADVLELGIPFSDPLADGPTIQHSSQVALEAGVSTRMILDRIEERGAAWNIPIVLMTYVNPILAYGVDAFCKRARDVGVSGVLISDLPPEETPELWSALADCGLETTLLVAPTTRPERIATLAKAATGFVYCVSRTGVTGRGGTYATNVSEQVAAVRAHTDLPVVIGFGIRSPEDAGKMAPMVDGVVIGARLIEIIGGESVDAAIREEREFLSGVRSVLDTSTGSGEA